MRPWTRTAGVLCLLASLASGPAAAQPAGQGAASSASAARTKSNRADELVRRGIEIGTKDSWKAAEPLFREAWALKRSYDIAGNLGLSEAGMGKWREAAEHLRFALDGFPANAKQEHRPLLEETFAKARAEVGALVITVNLRGAQVLVDGIDVGTSPLEKEVFVYPGTRSVEARFQGYRDASATVSVQKGGTQKVALELAPPTAAGEMSEERPGVLIHPSAGQQAAPPVRWVPIVVGGGAAVVALGVGVGLTVVANGKSSDAAALQAQMRTPWECPAGTSAGAQCDALRDALEQSDALSNGAVAAFVIGGVLAAGTAGFAIWELSRGRSQAAVSVVPAIGPGAGGAVFTGRW